MSQAQSLFIITGDSDIYCTLYPLPGTDIRRVLTETLPATPGIASIQSHLVLRAPRQAVAWRLHRLTDKQTAALRREADAMSGEIPTSLGPLTGVELETLRLLLDDGRISAAHVARELDISRSTAYRTIQSLLEDWGRPPQGGDRARRSRVPHHRAVHPGCHAAARPHSADRAQRAPARGDSPP